MLLMRLELVLCGWRGTAPREGSLSVQTFVDESKVGGFSLAAASIPCSDVRRLRAMVSELRLPRQERLHFVAESPRRRREIMTALVAVGCISAVLYDARSFGSNKDGRNAAIDQMAGDVALIPASRIVVEAEDSAVRADQVIIRQRLEKAGIADGVGLDHLRAKDEPLLAIPDALAWCFTKGGEWMKLADPLIADIVQL
jgi:hypothetical protein